MNPIVIEYPVFRDNRGNRFILPNVYKSNDPDLGIFPTTLWSYCRQFEAVVRVTQEKYFFAAELDSEGMLNFTHVVSDVGSRGFAHGGATVWIIGGPEYDKDI